jgi:hypothetical protein
VAGQVGGDDRDGRVEEAPQRIPLMVVEGEAVEQQQ